MSPFVGGPNETEAARARRDADVPSPAVLTLLLESLPDADCKRVLYELLGVPSVAVKLRQVHAEREDLNARVLSNVGAYH